ncbi:hypothetical protein A2U01_0077986, partial [Trifolium medium]|nr:hypothetical protein [Trifolium medium]
TISEEQLQAFILKAREKKNLSQATIVPDPLSQLVVDDPTSKGSKRKTPEETTCISIQIPKKGVAPPPKVTRRCSPKPY